MHRQLAVFLTLFFPISSAYSSRVWVGPELGGNVGFATTADPSASGSARAGLIAGLRMQSHLAHGFSLRGSLTFAQQGVNTQLFGLVAGTVALEGLYVPVSVVWHATHWVQLFAGPEFSFFTSRSLLVGGVFSTGLSGRINPVDFGLHAGVGTSFPIIAGWHAFIDARFSMGLANLDASAGHSYQNRAIRIVAGAMYLL